MDFITCKFRYDGQRGLYIALKSLLSFIGSHPSLINVDTSLTYLPVTKQAVANCSLCSLVERNFGIGYTTSQ